MLLLDLPLVLVQDIVQDAVRSSERFPALELRRVNRFFEEHVTKCFAKYRMCDIVCDRSKRLPEAMKCRLIRLYIGAGDRSGLNGVQTHIHKVAARLHGLDSTVTLEDWIMSVCTSIARCHFGAHHRWNFGQHFDQGWSTSISMEEAVDDEAVLFTSLAVTIIMDRSEAFDSILRSPIPLRLLPEPLLFFGSAVEIACQWGNLEHVRSLLAAGYEVHLLSAIPKSLEQAIARDDGPLVRLLLDSCGSQITVTRIKQSAEGAARLGKFAALEEFIKDRPTLLNTDKTSAKNICFYAAWQGRDDIVNRCIEGGACDEIRGYFFPLLSAIEKGHLSTCEIILRHMNEDIAQEDYHAISRKLAVGGNLKILRLLESKGVRVEEPARFFAIAAEHGHLDLLSFSIKKGFHADYAEANALQRLALLRSIKKHHHVATEFLFSKLKPGVNGSEALKWDEIKTSPLITAIDSGCINQVRMLRQLGATAEKSSVIGTDFTLKARKERSELLFASSAALKISDASSWKEGYAKQRMVDKALEAALHDGKSWRAKALARTTKTWIRNLW